MASNKTLYIAVCLSFTLTLLAIVITYNITLTVNTDPCSQLQEEENHTINTTNITAILTTMRATITNKSGNISKRTNHQTIQTQYSLNISDLIHQRTTMPPKCIDSSHNLLEIEPKSHNWAPFYFRCNYKPKFRNIHQKIPWSDEAFITKELFYNHVFKAGGSTIQNALTELARNGKLKSLTKLNSNNFVISGGKIAQFSTRKNKIGRYGQNTVLNNFLNDDTIIFSFVRDPVDKFLSAFYEAHIRILKDHEVTDDGIPRILEYEKLTGIEIMRAWIDAIKESIKEQDLLYIKNKMPRKTVPMHDPTAFKTRMQKIPQNAPNTNGWGNKNRRKLGVNYINSHLPPSTHFLVDQDWKTNIPFTFIGDLYNYNNDFPQILKPLIIDEELKQNRTKLMKYLETQRDRSSDNKFMDLSKFSLKRSQLDKDDISSLCDIYWMDYLCFPFDIPIECDLEKMFTDHYGVELLYKDCY